ncbi:PTS sugar transporter subunit IIC [Agathobaculum sp. Marseille-P7918]|uniref:PTS sugar transporter subunit IIC n=1 Tax=Agathobaculum sp. Marseille-P7918 TaxID=2479843 RepID=UPI000F63E129|nr:PTS transporter subunit EIIC [Agathobaculum sp. Marseille-P7918]
MNKFMTWLAQSFAPKCKKVFENPWIDAVASTMKKVLPFILTGSVISFYNVFRSYLAFLPDLGVIFSYTFGFLAIYITFLVTHEAMLKLKHEQYQVYASLTAIGLYFILCQSMTTEEGMFQVIGERIGASGIMMGLVTGLLTSVVFHFYAKLKVLSGNDSLPDFVIEWINNIIPIGLTLGVGMVLATNLQLDIYQYILAIFMPLQNIAQTLPGLILICLIQAMLYSMGISAWIFNAVTTPIFMMAISENITAVASGMAAMNITTSETVFTAALITMGGVGATLPLNVLMLRSKSSKMKTIGRICIAPSLFNINEPLMFGAPVVFNPLLMLPVWINNIVGPVVVWFSMRAGLLNIPSKMIQVGQIPAPFSSVMITEDLRAVVVYIVLFVLYLLVWYPFYKVYEKQCVTEEAAG